MFRLEQGEASHAARNCVCRFEHFSKQVSAMSKIKEMNWGKVRTGDLEPSQVSVVIHVLKVLDSYQTFWVLARRHIGNVCVTSCDLALQAAGVTPGVRECSAPASHIRTMQKGGVLQPLSALDPCLSGTARAGKPLPWKRTRKQVDYALPTSGSKSSQLGGGKEGKLNSPFFSTATGGADF